MSELLLVSLIVLPMLGAILSPLIGIKNENVRDAFNIILTGIVFSITCILFVVINKSTIEISIPYIMGTGLQLKLDMFRYVFVLLTSFIWFMSTIYSTQYIIKYNHRNRYYSFFIFTLGCTMGIFLSENILNLFTFFEIMSFTSYALVIHDEDVYSHEAGISYLSMSIAGGLVLLLGIFLLYDDTGTLLISEMSSHFTSIGTYEYVIAFLVITGFGVKASMFPLHVWVPKAYSSAPAPASAVLAGVLKKAGIFGIMLMTMVIIKNDFYISVILIVIGFINILLGGVSALLQRNIKRILAYSSMSQAGYILIGIGMIGLLKEHALTAFVGTIMHIINHGLFKVLLFLGAGILYMVLGELSINKIKGFGVRKYRLTIIFLVGIFGIIGMPGFNGYISKTLLHDALSELHHMYSNNLLLTAEILFTIGSALTTAYMCKLFITVFVEKNDKYRGKYVRVVKKRAQFPMYVISFVILFIGVFPKFFLNIIVQSAGNLGIHGELDISLFAFSHVKTSLITISLGILIYLLVVRTLLYKKSNGDRTYVNPAINWLSLESDIYKPFIVLVFKLSTVVFRVIDKFLIRSIDVVSDVTQVMADWEGPNISKKKMTINITKPNLSYFKRRYSFGRFKYPKTIQINLSKLVYTIKKAHQDISSTSYSIYLLGIVMIVVMGSLFYYNGII